MFKMSRSQVGRYLKVASICVLTFSMFLFESCKQSTYRFPKFGYKQFDKFASQPTQGEILITEEHEANLVIPYRSYFLFGMIKDTFPGRMNMGPIYVAGDYFEQAFNVWAAPLTGPIAGRMNEIKVYTKDKKILFQQDLYFPKSVEAVFPDTLKKKMILEWRQDKSNDHGVVLELSHPSDTAFGLNALDQGREFFYIPKDDGKIEINSSIWKAANTMAQDSIRVRLYRGNFATIKTGFRYPNKVHFLIWSAAYKMMYIKPEEVK